MAGSRGQYNLAMTSGVKKKLMLPVVLSVVVIGGAVSFASCGDGKPPGQDGAATDAIADAPRDAQPDTPIV